MKRSIILLSIAAVAVSGCATKRYGRLTPLTGAERSYYSCRDIDLEIAKVEAFKQQVIEGAQFNMASVLGILGDYGIGNTMERGAAEASAAKRLGQLNDLKAERGCAATSLSTYDQRSATLAATNAGSARMSGDPLDAPGTIDLGRGVKLISSGSLSGYCIKAAPGYVGTGSVQTPIVTRARPLCT